KHDPAEEFLAVALAAAVAHEADAGRVFKRPSLFFKKARETRPRLGRVAQIKTPRRALVDAALFQIFERLAPFAGGVQLILKVAPGALVQLIERFLFFRAWLHRRRLKPRHLDAVAFSHPLDRLGERDVVVLHEKMKDAAARAAAEAAEDRLLLV